MTSSQAGDVWWVGGPPCFLLLRELLESVCGTLVLHDPCSVNPRRPSCTRGGFCLFLKCFLSPSGPPRTNSLSLLVLHLKLKNTNLCSSCMYCSPPCSPPPGCPSVFQVFFCPPDYLGLEPLGLRLMRVLQSFNQHSPTLSFFSLGLPWKSNHFRLLPCGCHQPQPGVCALFLRPLQQPLSDLLVVSPSSIMHTGRVLRIDALLSLKLLWKYQAKTFQFLHNLPFHPQYELFIRVTLGYSCLLHIWWFSAHLFFPSFSPPISEKI